MKNRVLAPSGGHGNGKTSIVDNQKAMAFYESLGDAKYREFRVGIEQVMSFSTSFEKELKKTVDILLAHGLIEKVETYKDHQTLETVIRVWRKSQNEAQTT